MLDTQSASSQGERRKIVDDNTAWDNPPFSEVLPEGRSANPIAAVAALTLTTLTIPAPFDPGLLTAVPADQAPVRADWRAELRARYDAMAKTSWFRAAHEGRSLGDPIKIL